MGSWPDRSATRAEPAGEEQDTRPPPAGAAKAGTGATADERIIDVVAGVVADPRGRILLARRTRGRDLAGFWEFPGGKIDPGETAEQALVRELQEELGIQAEPGEPLIRVPHRYPHKRLRLDVRRIAAYRGVPKGLDGQALAWVPPHKLVSYPMPAADRPVVAALEQPPLYLVTPGPGADDQAWLAALARALEQGIRRVQLRSHSTDAPRWAELCRRATELCREAGAEVLVNHDVALASALGTGVHLRAAQLAALPARPLPPELPVAASCHSTAELLQAERLQCDFAVVGPLRETPSHPGRPGLGWAGFAALRERVALPLYAIGGLRADDLTEARRHGAQGIAAIRGLWP